MRLRAIDCAGVLRRSLFFFAIAFIYGCFCSHAVSDQGDGVCVSQGGHFAKFSLEGHPPRKASKGAIGLTLCKFYKKRTCCDVVQTQAALLSLQRLATTGEASKDCLEKWEVLECSICDPRVGVNPGPPLLCQDFCNSVFSACAGAFFATEPLSQVLMPCGPRDVLCAPAQEWASNSSMFCHLTGFSVVDVKDHLPSLERKHCFDGKFDSTESRYDEIERKPRSPRKAQHYSAVDMLRNWIAKMNVAEQIMWATGGLVLTAGALYLRQKSLVKKNASAAIIRNKLLHEEAKARQQAAYKSSTSPGSRKERRHALKAAA